MPSTVVVVTGLPGGAHGTATSRRAAVTAAEAAGGRAQAQRLGSHRTAVEEELVSARAGGGVLDQRQRTRRAGRGGALTQRRVRLSGSRRAVPGDDRADPRVTHDRAAGQGRIDSADPGRRAVEQPGHELVRLEAVDLGQLPARTAIDAANGRVGVGGLAGVEEVAATAGPHELAGSAGALRVQHWALAHIWGREVLAVGIVPAIRRRSGHARALLATGGGIVRCPHDQVPVVVLAAAVV